MEPHEFFAADRDEFRTDIASELAAVRSWIDNLQTRQDGIKAA